MTAKMMMATISRFGYNRPFSATRSSSFVVRMSSVAAPKKMTGGGGGNYKKSINELLLTPRFYTTDFEEIEVLFNTEMNKNLNEAKFEALLQEFKTDYNQTHFVRNKEFKQAADMNLPQENDCYICNMT